MTPEKIVLDIGCGKDKKKGAIGIDKVKTEETNIVLDIEDSSLPFDDGSVDKAYMDGVLEHLTSLHILEEIHRVLKPDKSLIIKLPPLEGFWEDPTHQRPYTFDSLRYLLDSHKFNYYFDFSFRKLKIRSFKLSYSSPFKELGGRVLNKLKWLGLMFHENVFSLFPNCSVEIELVK